MKYSSSDNKKYYFPPVLSNGEISFAPDAEGMLGYTVNDYRKKGVEAFDGIVVRVARRTAKCTNLNSRFFPLGKFTFGAPSPLSSWSQELFPERGCFESDCTYEDGIEIHSCGFIHPELNVYALRKTFKGIGGKKSFSFDLSLTGYNEEVAKYMNILSLGANGSHGYIDFKMCGMTVFSGEINAFVDKPFSVKKTDSGINITFDASDGESVCFFYYIEDDMYGADFRAVLEDLKKKIDSAGFDGLLKDCEKHFADFYSLGYVNTPDERLNSIYKTSLYSVKSNTTRSSVAVGFNNGSWDGRYFAFDEYSSLLGLLGANRLELAKRVPTYRLNKCLPHAVGRMCCHKSVDVEDLALFHWESGEDDSFELAPNGGYLNHVFHIPLIGLGAYNYFEYSEDLEFLSECYKMIRACAKFMTRHMIYRDGDRYYIGKCCDLERLGSSVENPFMTSCGTIKLLSCCSKAAGVLGIDKEYAKECDFLASKLYESLPADEQKYVPFAGCEQKSIAVYAGKYPFDILKGDDDKMLAAWRDFEDNGSAYGNMYPTGKGISAWYACWKCMAYSRSSLKEMAYPSLKQAYRSVGVFDEFFEINEEKVSLRPWFATAAGIFISSVNELLLQCEGNVINILPAFPKAGDVSFKLAAKGGITVEANIKDGKLEKVLILKNGVDVSRQYTVNY